MKVECSSQLLPTGAPVLRIVFSGELPEGSRANDDTNRMAKYAASLCLRERPQAVLFDLSALTYTWGDGICVIATELMRLTGRAPLPFRTGVLAGGATHDALKPLFERPWTTEMAGMRLFQDLNDAFLFLVTDEAQRS